MPKVRQLQKLVPLDVRERQMLQAVAGGLNSSASAEDRAAKFREEIRMLTGKLTVVLRENVALRKANEAFASRIQALERGEE